MPGDNRPLARVETHAQGVVATGEIQARGNVVEGDVAGFPWELSPTLKLGCGLCRCDVRWPCVTSDLMDEHADHMSSMSAIFALVGGRDEAMATEGAVLDGGAPIHRHTTRTSDYGPRTTRTADHKGFRGTVSQSSSGEKA